MSSDSAVNTAWLVFNLTGQWSLLALLLTFGIVKHLPQRHNPFLINFLLTTFLGTLPPALLLYTGHLSVRREPPDALCFVQAALVDGVAPMFGVAQVILLLDTWSELRSLCFHKRHVSRTTFIKYLLMFMPYIAMWIWVFASFIAAAQSKAKHVPGFAFCRNDSKSSDAVRKYVGVFMLVFAMIELALVGCIGWFFYHFPAKTQKDPAAWRSKMHFALRIFALSFVQLIALILSVANAGGINSYAIKVAYELLTSMNSLATFVAFGTQRCILQAWKICRKTEPKDTSPPPVYSLDWSNVTQRQSMQFHEDAFEFKEGQIADGGYFKPWLRVGQIP